MSLRIAMFTDNFYPELGGIQDSIMAAAPALAELGHEVRIYAPAAAERDYSHAGRPVGEAELGEHVSVFRLPATGVASSSQQSRLALPALMRDLRAFSPDLAHVHTFLGAGLAGRHAARRMGLPLIGTNHWHVGGFCSYAPAGGRWAGRIAEAAVSRFYRTCDAVTAPSRFILDAMAPALAGRRALVVSNPIDIETFRPVGEPARGALRARWGMRGPAVAYAGRLGREKRVDVLIDALALARERQRGLTLHVAGHGSARVALERQARHRGIGEAVHFVGTLDHARLAGFLAAADAFAIASTSESQSMVMLQAMACATPIIAARAGGMSEYVPREAGFLAEPDNAESFAARIGAALDPGRRASLRDGSAAFARRLSVASVARTWSHLYGDLAASRRSARRMSA